MINIKQLNLILNTQHIHDNESIIIHRVGRYEDASTHSICRKKGSLMPEVIFIYCMAGEGWLTVNDHTIMVKPGMGILCDKNTLHSYGSSIDNPWTITWIHVTGMFIQQCIIRLDTLKNCKAFCIQDFFTVEHLMKKTVEYLETNRLSSSIQLPKAYIEAVFFQLLIEQEAVTCIISSQKYIQMSIEYMKENLYSQLCLEQLCKHVNLSKYYFIRSFKKATGSSPMAYFTQLKIQKACRLLIEDDLQVQHISENLGFSTPYYFSEQFKKVTGYSPKEYRIWMRMQH